MAVERNAENSAIPAVFGGDGRDMGDMVLDGDHRQARRVGPARRHEIGVQISDRAFRFDLEDRSQALDRLVAEANGFAVVEIANVLRNERLAAAGDRNRVLEVAAGGDDARALGAEIDGIGDEPTRPPDIRGRAVH